LKFRLIIFGVVFVLALSAKAALTTDASAVPDDSPAGNRGVLSILGSSVALGVGSSGRHHNQYVSGGSFSNGYAADLTVAEATNGWRVVNQSISGNNTTAVINRFYTDEVPVHADVDLIGLSLGNEGLHRSARPEVIFNRFFAGITNLIAMSRANHLRPILGNQYSRNAYTANEYAWLKRMDLLVNTLDVPSVNFLGATDDGFGHWVSNAFINLLGTRDGIHPNDAGYHEMYLCIVPSVFDALKAGKPTPQWGDSSKCLRLTGDPGQAAPLSFTPSRIMHSFTLSFRVRSTTIGTVAAITLPDSSVHPTVEITPTGLAYLGTGEAVINSGVSGTNNLWHEVVVAHAWARGQTWFYVDGVLAGTVSERLTPIGFILGGHGNAMTRPGSPVRADYQNWLVHRSMMNVEEVTAQHEGHFQQASLELYAPLDDNAFVPGTSVTNRAQSLATAIVNGQASNYQSALTLGKP
jgi:lysophospholipase L1-like esterase